VLKQVGCDLSTLADRTPHGFHTRRSRRGRYCRVDKDTITKRLSWESGRQHVAAARKFAISSRKAGLAPGQPSM
jgi:hypothetical protein